MYFVLVINGSRVIRDFPNEYKFDPFRPSVTSRVTLRENTNIAFPIMAEGVIDGQKIYKKQAWWVNCREIYFPNCQARYARVAYKTSEIPYS